jgi:hypothetical protein
VKDWIALIAIMAVLAIELALFAGLVALILIAYRRFERNANATLKRQYEDLYSHVEAQPGDVRIVYPTYHGLIVWFTETQHRAILPPQKARDLLWRLLRFNLLWGWSAQGGIFVIPLSLYNYWAQLRSIDMQEAENAFAVTNPGRPFAQPSKPRLSILRRVFGWSVVGFALLFVVFSLISIWQAEFTAAFGGLFLAALFAWLARDFVGKPVS